MERKRRFGDRKDGWRLRHTQSVFAVMPHIMKKRSDAQVFFDDVIEIDELEKWHLTAPSAVHLIAGFLPIFSNLGSL